MPLGPFPARITDTLEYWADRAPDRVFLAQRHSADGRRPMSEPTAGQSSPEGTEASRRVQVPVPSTHAAGEWRTVTYKETLARVRSLAQALIDRGLSSERPVAILSGNSIEHGLLALACMYAGVLYAPISPAYSLQAREYGALRHVFGLLRPGLVFAGDARAYDRALRAVLTPDIELVASEPGDLSSVPFAELLDTTATSDVDEACGSVGPDTIAKILFTSGSTGHPKGVINTQRMLCANQEMIRSVLCCLDDEPPVLCDWLPWNHTAGGNHNFGLVLYNGGTLYIDEGRPTLEGIAATVRNLREISVTAHFGVPRSYEMLMPYLRTDPVLRRTFFQPADACCSTPPPGSASGFSTSFARWRSRPAAKRFSG